MDLLVSGIDFASFYDFSIEFLNCFYSVMRFVCHFISRVIALFSLIGFQFRD